jgi:AraC-like DNA-binding protein
VGSIEFVLYSPPRSLARDVSCLRLAHRDGEDPVQVKVCPNGTPGMVLHLCGTEPAIATIATRSREISWIPRFFVYGQGSEPSVMTFKPGPLRVLQVALKPQALSTLFSFDASALPQGFITDEHIGAQELVPRLISATSDEQLVADVWAFLEQKLAGARGQRDELVETSLELIHGHLATMTVQKLLDRLPISQRQFEKRFARAVGCPPQKYIRVKRINEALRLMKTGQYEKLSDIAYSLNFYDQSHFIREIKTFSWLTPKLISQKVSEFQQDETGSSWE